MADLTGAAGGDALRYSAFVVPATPLADGLYRVSGTGFTRADLFFTNVGPKGEALQAVVNAVPTTPQER